MCLFFLLTATFVIALPLLLLGNEPSEFSFTFAESFYLKHWRVCVMFLGSLYHIVWDFVNFTFWTLLSTGWITEYHKSRPGLNVLQQRIDDYITAHEAQLEQVICPLEQWQLNFIPCILIHYDEASETDFMSFDYVFESYISF